MGWWAGRRSENLFMEITNRERLGDDLLAPVSARGGGATGSYVLVPQVEPGDMVVHYHSVRRRIEGVSTAVGYPEPTYFRWAARGVSARQARVTPTWKPSVRVPLGQYVPLEEPVTLEHLRGVEPRIMEIRDDLRRTVGEKTPLYFPWMPYRGQPMRTSETYLAKLPRAVVTLFPSLRKAVSSAAGRRSSERIERSPADIAEDAIEGAGSRGRTRRGQGFVTDQMAKAALEARAMDVAYEYFSRFWDVEDVHATSSFDFRCRRNGAEMHVEVKGTASAGDDVLLTPNEVRHAQAFGHVVLFVLADVRVTRRDDGSVEAWGGRATVLDPWTVDESDLRPVGYRYRVPQSNRRTPGPPA